MAPEAVYIDEKFVKKPPKVSQTEVLKRRNRFRDRSLKGFVAEVLEDGSSKAFINARFLGEKSPRNRYLGYIGRADDNDPEHWRKLVKEIKNSWANGDEHPFFNEKPTEEVETFANKMKELLAAAPDLKDQKVKPKLMEDKRITVFDVPNVGKVKTSTLRPRYSDGKGNGVRSKTTKNYFTYWNNHVATSKVKVKIGKEARTLKLAKIKSINTETLAAWAEAMKNLHKEITKKGQVVNADKVLQFLRGCFESWGKKGKLNPVIAALSAETGLFSRSEGSKWNKAKPKETRELEEKEVKRILKTIIKTLDKYQKLNDRLPQQSKRMRTLTMLLFKIFTGGRFDWIQTLRWEQLDHKNWVKVITKGREFNKIIQEDLIKLVKRYVEEDDKNKYIFWSNEALGGYIVDYDEAWKETLIQAKIPYTKPKQIRTWYNDLKKNMGYEETTRKIAMTQSAQGINEKWYSSNFKSQYKLEKAVHNRITAFL